MNLYNGRNKINEISKGKDITPSMYAYNAKSEPKEYDGVEESEQKFDESIGKKVKLGRQESHKLDKMIYEKDEI